MRNLLALFVALALAAGGCGGTQNPGGAGAGGTGGAGGASDLPGGGSGGIGATGGAAEAPEAKGTPSADVLPRALLFGNPDKAGPQLSPDGKQIAFLAAVDGVLNVWVAPVSALDQARAVTADKTRPVTQYFWAYTNKHIIYLQDTGGDEDWHVFAVDLAAGKTTDLTPLEKVAAQVFGVSHRHPDTIVVGLNDRVPMLHDAWTVNVLTGERKLLQENPGMAGFAIDDDYRVRLGLVPLPDGGMALFTKKAAAPAAKGKAAPADPMAGWAELQKIGAEDIFTTSPVGFDQKGTTVYLVDSRGRNTAALTAVDLATGKSKVIAEHARADAGAGLLVHPTTNKVQAVGFEYARREWKFLDPAVKADFDKLARVADGDANVVSRTLDDRTWIVAFDDDDGPVRWYLWDRKAGKETFLFSNRRELEGKTLARMHPVMIKARDGLELVSYLSLPPGSDPDGDGKPAAPTPMVLWVHGGPWARDSWGYDAAHQLLASRGYAVLSVNYRGSTGFGKELLNAANLEWAGKMHDDLLDAVAWAVAQGITPRDKVCIGGGSYGGYATLIGLTFTPEVFACGVDIVGPSSLVTLFENMPPYWKPMEAVLKARVGDWTSAEGKKFLESRSALFKADEIVRPLLIGQGANDPRVTQVESDQLVKAMQARGIPVTYVLFPDEGHGFARTPNRMVFFAAAEAFLSAHLGGVYQPAGAEEFKGTTMKVLAGDRGVPGLPGLIEQLGK